MIVIDNFIKDPSFIKQLEDNKDYLFGDNGSYHWWNGWWNSSDDTIKKQLISYIWRDYPIYPSVNLDGFEYWTGQFGEGMPNASLGMHLDKDEALWKNTGEISSPIVGTVFYPVEMDIDGGYLEVFSNGPEKQPERIRAKHNRLIIFDAGGVHHRVTEVTRGTRSAVAINLWDKKPTGELKEE